MAVYERTYRGYEGPRTSRRSRLWVLPRYAYKEVFRSRLFVAFYGACFVWPLVLLVLVYLPHNMGFLKTFSVNARSLLVIDAHFFFRWFMVPQGALAFLVSFLVGPALISPDLRNNAMALYLSRPLSRTEYAVGKGLVLATLLSAITWIPGLVLFLFQGYLEGGAWLVHHSRIGAAVFLASWTWILTLSLLSLAISAWVRVKPIAAAALFGTFFVSSGLANTLNLVFRTRWGSLLDIGESQRVVWASLFGVSARAELPAAAAWLSVTALCLFCIFLLARKVRAYHVVR